MTRKMKPIEIPVPGTIREAVFSVAVPIGDGGDGTFTTVGTLVEEAQRALGRANEVLSTNALVALAAQDMARQYRRRGHSSISIRADGEVVFRVQYTDPQDPLPPEPPSAPGGAGLPLLSALRERAGELGVDISDLGRQKRKIMRRLAEASLPPDSPKTMEEPPPRLRDEVTTSTPLHTTKLPGR